LQATQTARKNRSGLLRPGNRGKNIQRKRNRVLGKRIVLQGKKSERKRIETTDGRSGFRQFGWKKNGFDCLEKQLD
jgi:hypothetical protein